MPSPPRQAGLLLSRPYLAVALSPLLVVKAIGLALLYLLASPAVLLVDLVAPRRHLAAGWVVGFMVLALAVTAGTWSVAFLADEPQLAGIGGMVHWYYQARDHLEELPYGDLIRLYAARNDLDPALLAAVVQMESNFDPNAVSRVGARGLMQLLPATWRYLYPESSCDGEHPPPSRGPDCIFEPAANLRVGARYLRQLLGEFDGDVVLAVAAYNAGAGAVRRLGTDQAAGIPPFRETGQFVRGVLGAWRELRGDPEEIAAMAEARLIHRLRRVTPFISTGLWLLLCLWVLRRLPWTLDRLPHRISA